MFTKIKNFVQDSLFFDNIDNISYIILLLILLCALFCQTEILGLLGYGFCFLVLFKIIFKKASFKLEGYEKALILYFLFVTLSLFGSSLFMLSLHGYLKTLTYILFYFSCAVFYNSNRNKIFSTFLFISILMSYEAVVAIIQNYSGVVEISGWQDTTGLNPEQIVARAYGTLKPYNPNLLAGYLLCGLSSFIYLCLTYLNAHKRRIALIFAILFLINLIAIIDTGCRGAYLGFMLFFPVLFMGLIVYAKKRFGGLSNIKKRYKNIALASILAIIAFILANPSLIRRFESIFALRADSSISFRLNVYESAVRMFLDNFFLGIGVGNQNFREIYGLYMKSGYDALGSYCVPLEIAVESGIFALIAIISFVVFVMIKCYKVAKFDKKNILNSNCHAPTGHADSTRAKILCFSIVLMLCAVIGHGFFDTIWFRPQVQMLFWVYIAMLKAL